MNISADSAGVRMERSMSTEDINDVGSSWRRVIRILEQDERVSPRQRGFVVLTQPQGLIGNTLLVAVPNELTREVLQTQLHTALSDALCPSISGRNRLRLQCQRRSCASGQGRRGGTGRGSPSK